MEYFYRVLIKMFDRIKMSDNIIMSNNMESLKLLLLNDKSRIKS